MKWAFPNQPWDVGDKPSPGHGRSLGRWCEGRLGASSRQGPGQGWCFSEAQPRPRAPGCLEEGCAGSLGRTTEGMSVAEAGPASEALGPVRPRCGRDTRKARVCPAGGESGQQAPGELLTGIQEPGGVTMAPRASRAESAGRICSSLGDPEGVERQWRVAEPFLSPHMRCPCSPQPCSFKVSHPRSPALSPSLRPALGCPWRLLPG